MLRIAQSRGLFGHPLILIGRFLLFLKRSINRPMQIDAVFMVHRANPHEIIDFFLLLCQGEKMA